MTTALGIAPDSAGAGLTAAAHRQVIKAHWLNTGIVTGLTVSGRTDLSYQVGPGVAVCSRGDADGYTEAYWDGGAVGPVAAGGSGPRIDVIWIRANDPTQGDADNHVTLGVAQGTPSPTPVAPPIPAGCTPVARRTMPANASSTNAASDAGAVPYALPYGASLGRLAFVKATNSYQVPEDKDKNGKMVWHDQLKTAVTLPTRRLVRIQWKACSTVGISSGSDKNERVGSYYVQLQVDGAAINDIPQAGRPEVSGACDELESTRYYETKYIEYEQVLEPGTHTILARVCGDPTDGSYPVTLVNIRSLTVTDIGVA